MARVLDGPGIPARGQRGGRPFGRLAIAVCAAALSLVLPAPLADAVAQVQPIEADAPGTVPLPGGGASDWDGIVVPPDAAAAPGAPHRPGDAVDSGGEPLGGDLTRIHVKFHEGTSGDATEGGDLGALLAANDAVATPLFTRSPDALRADRRVAEERTGDAQPDLTTWVLIEVPDETRGTALVDALSAHPDVEMVQPEPTLAVTQLPDEQAMQGYLRPGLSGIDAEWAWTQSGGTGSNVTVALIDSGFDTAHPDLDTASQPGVAIAHQAPWDSHHGLQVLGIIAADDDGDGLLGIAHGSGLHTINSGRDSGDIANAIDLATNALGAGDVISISQGICAVAGCADNVVLPLVYSASARDALRVAVGKGIIPVVSGGNGGANLDNYASRLGADAPGAIVVGAANPPPTSGCAMEDGPARGRVSTSNYGSRVDLQGWGACTRTAEAGGGYKWWGFTSGATPVVAGAAALTSSIAQQRLGVELTSSQVRALFRASGSPQTFAGTRGGSIGPLPDVRDAVELFRAIPDHDMWSDARELTLSRTATVATADVRFAGVEVDEPAVVCGAISSTVWYTVTPTRTTDVTISTHGSDFDTIVGLWRLDGSSLERVGCNDDRTPNNPRSELTRTLTVGETYYVQVGGGDGDGGSVRLSLAPAIHDGVGCDLDGDGFGEVAVGVPGEKVGGAPDAGRVVVLDGRGGGRPSSPTAVTQEWPGVAGSSERGDGFGRAVACGDFDADGRADLVVGAPRENTGGARNAGAVRVIPGTGAGLGTADVLTLTQGTRGISSPPQKGDRFGSALAVGDFDGDGYDDLAVASAGEDVQGLRNVGTVHVIPGSAGGLDASAAERFHQASQGVPGFPEAGQVFGTALATGDFDGDGYDELAVGVPKRDVGGATNGGKVMVLRGSMGGLTTAGAIALVEGSAPIGGVAGAGHRFGAALASGDVDGDGRDDLVVGAPGRVVGGRSVAAGGISVVHGSPAGIGGAGVVAIDRTVAGVAGRARAGDRFGASVAVVDLDGDGFDDVAVGVPGHDSGPKADTGAIHTFGASASGLDPGRNRLIREGGPLMAGFAEPGDRFGSVLGAADTDGNGRWDLLVGTPHEDVEQRIDAGAVVLIPGGVNGAARKRSSVIAQHDPRSGRNDRGDSFGAAIAGR